MRFDNPAQTVPIDPSACLVGISYATIPATGTLEQPGFMQKCASRPDLCCISLTAPHSLYTSGQLSTTGAFGMYLVRAADVSGAASSGNATTNLISGSEICIDCVRQCSFTDAMPASTPYTGRHLEDRRPLCYDSRLFPSDRLLGWLRRWRDDQRSITTEHSICTSSLP